MPKHRWFPKRGEPSDTPPWCREPEPETRAERVQRAKDEGADRYDEAGDR